MRQLVRPPMRAQLNLSSRAGTNKWKYHLSTFGVISGDTGSFVPCAFLIHKFEDAHILRDAMDCLGFALARLQYDGSDAAAAAAVRLSALALFLGWQIRQVGIGVYNTGTSKSE